MRQTTERAGSVRYAPDRGHRDTAATGSAW